jgi:hypothetical protein
VTGDDLRLHILAHDLSQLDARRLQLDAPGADDVSRADANESWSRCANEILSLQATTRNNLRTKCRVLRALIADTGSAGPVVAAALSIAADIERSTR